MWSGAQGRGSLGVRLIPVVVQKHKKESRTKGESRGREVSESRTGFNWNFLSWEVFKKSLVFLLSACLRLSRPRSGHSVYKERKAGLMDPSSPE